MVVSHELREVLEKGPKYRERREKDWEKVRAEVKRTIGDTVVRWCAY